MPPSPCLSPFLALIAAAAMPMAPSRAQTMPPPAPAPGSMTLDQFLARQTGQLMAADSDGDGRISRAELAASARGGRDPSMLFDRMDLNHDGYLDATEIRTALTRRFQRMDANSDGVVTAEERMAARPMMARTRRAPALTTPE